jgi:transcriptional regulator GlxA family with amidase domain
MIDIVFVVLPHTLLLDLAGPAEAFRLANQRLVRRGGKPAFRLRYVSPQPEAPTSVGVGLTGLEPLPDRFDAALTWVVLLGQPSGDESPLRKPLPRAWTDTRRWLAQRAAPALGERVHLLTVCAGALLAADAGLLAGRRCTTHHEMLDTLAQLAPTASIQANRVFVVDGPVATSAGVTAGIDLALHLVAEACGEATAAAVAQTMVVFQRRGPDDPELSPLRSGRDHLHAAIHRVQDAVCEQPQADWSLQAMARVAHVTPRHLARLFREHVGHTPREYVEGVRVAIVEQALNDGRPAKQAIAAAGIGSDRQWRRVRSRLAATP